MTIVKNSYRISRLDDDFSHGTALIEDDADECSLWLSATDGVSDDGASDADSGMASDEFDFSELGEPGMEVCQVGNQRFMFPLELYDLSNLGLVLSLNTWNACLTEEERFALAEYLPDVDQDDFAVTLKELFSGSNFHFGCPLSEFFNQLKGGLCDPMVVLERRGLNIFQRQQHYHYLRKYQNSMVESLIKIRDAWESCDGYGIEERVRLLNIMRSQRSLGYSSNGELGFHKDSGSSESDEAYSNKSFRKAHGRLVSSKNDSFNSLAQRSRMPNEPSKFVKEKAKGILKVAAPKASAKKESVRGPDFDLTKVGRSGSEDNYFADSQYGSDLNAPCNTTITKSDHLKSKRKGSSKRSGHDLQSDFGEEDPVEYVRTSVNLNRRKKSDLAVAIASYDSYNYSALSRTKKPKQSEDCKYPAKQLPRGSTIYSSDPIQSYIQKRSDSTREITDMSDSNKSNSPKQRYPTGWTLHSSDTNWSRRHTKVYGEASCVDHPGAFGDSRRQKRKCGDDFRTNSSSLGFDSKVSPCKTSSVRRSGSCFRSGRRTKYLQGQSRRKASHHEGAGMEGNSPVHAQSEETQSDSSGQVEEGRDMYPYAKSSVHPSAAGDVRAPLDKQDHGYRSSTRVAKLTGSGSHPPDGGICCQTPEQESYTRKVKKKVKANDVNSLDGDESTKKERRTHFSEKLQPASHSSCTVDRKRKGRSDVRYFVEQANEPCNHVRNISEAEDSTDLNGRVTVIGRQTNRSESKCQNSTDYTMENDPQKRSCMHILDCSTLPKKKKKGKGGDEFLDELDEPVQHYSSPNRQIEGSSARKKKGKRKAGLVVANSSIGIPEPMIIDKEQSELEMDRNPHKKLFTLITPTIHTGFSFSIIHLLSAVRKALITAQLEDTEDIGNHLGKDDPSMLAKRGDYKVFLSSPNGIFLPQSLDHLEGSILQHGAPQCNLPALSVQEIVHRVKTNPGDPCILETPEPLQDLVRGVLKVFSSKTAPLGAKGWKALVLYDKSIKSWSWIGPVPSLSDNEEETSAEAWNIPHKMLVKLVDAFSNWLKNGQETLQQIGTLPAPPTALPVMDYKDRFRDLRAQKSLNTISPSSEELRGYFHREERLRYSIPDRAFHYTAVDGRKSIVAPLRRGGGKPTSKARDHYMLKTDRPPHVTVLCLVRDAASRLPGSIGTRADVCTLIRDSQYIVEDVTDAQVNQVVSGALDRLHYERDPCVQFDGERKLWVYLHQDREEEDFEDDGTSSTKKWKRQRKDVADPSEVEVINESNYVPVEEPAAGGSSACDLNPDLNIVSSDPNMAEKGELVYSDLRPNRENVQSYVNPSLCGAGQSNPIFWGVPLQETKMLCQENSKSQDFDDESFSRERPVGLLSAGLF